MGKTATGDPTPYSDADEAEIESALLEGWDDFGDDDEIDEDWSDSPAPPSRMTVSGVIEWSGSRNTAHGGHRTVRLDNLDLSAVAPVLDRARDTENRALRTTEATSYTAQGWQAQLRALTATPRGSELADRAGLNPSARTVRAWLSDSRAPSPANQRAIAEAYAGLRTYSRDQARAEARAARHEAVEAMTDAVRERYGAEVRFFDVQSIEFDD